MKKTLVLLLIAATLAACNRPMTRQEFEYRQWQTNTGLRMMEIGGCCHGYRRY